MPLSVAPALRLSPSSMRISYTALEVLLSLLRMAKVEHPKETIFRASKWEILKSDERKLLLGSRSGEFVPFCRLIPS
jgi:hypothetical protein